MLQTQPSDIEDTIIKKVDIQEDHNSELTGAQNTGDIKERAVPDSIQGQIEDNGITLENNGDYISDDQDPTMQDDQMSKASQDDNYHTAIDDDDDFDNTIQFGSPVTQPFLLRGVRVPTT